MSPPVCEGDILASKYRVERVLGMGGMGVVVAAHHIQLDERVAIKFLLPELTSSPEAVARFSREARAAVKIKSEHVARVSDVGTLENGAPYMVIEYLEGSDLSAWLLTQGALPVEQAAEFVLQACEAIAEAHALGIVHRDLKPSNIFVVRRLDGALSVKVLDFGISKMMNSGAPGQEAALTRTSALLGSPLYMPPEQIRSSRDVDPRGDIWALGVILYELIAGVSPFSAAAVHEALYRIVSEQPASLRTVRPDVPEGLEAVIQRCLEKDRGARYQSVGELAAALLPFGPKRSRISVERISGVMKAAGLSGSLLALPPPSESVEPGPQTATGASWSNTASRAPARTSRTIATVAIAMLGVGVVLTTVFVWSNRSATPETGSPAVIASQPTGDARSSPVPPKVGSEKTVSAILPDNGRREGEPATSAGSSALSSADGPTVLPAPEAIPSARHELPATRADPSPITSKRRNDPVTESRAPVPSAAPPSTGPAPAPPSPVNSAPPVQRKNVYDERK